MRRTRVLAANSPQVSFFLLFPYQHQLYAFSPPHPAPPVTFNCHSFHTVIVPHNTLPCLQFDSLIALFTMSFFPLFLSNTQPLPTYPQFNWQLIRIHSDGSNDARPSSGARDWDRFSECQCMCVCVSTGWQAATPLRFVNLL